MFRVHATDRTPLKTATLENSFATHGIGWAATAVMLAATMVIVFGAPI